MADNREKYYDLGAEIDRAKECRAVAGEIEEVVAGMAAAAWDTEIAAAEAAELADETADRVDDSAGGHLKSLSTELDGICRNIRTIGKSRFKLTDPNLADQFQDVPSTANTLAQILSRARLLNIAWGMTPDADTWEPIPGVTRAALQAKVAAVEAAETDASQKENAAKTAHNDAREKAVHLHNLTVAYRTQGLATFPTGSSKWVLFNSLPVTTPRRRRQPGDEGEGDGEPVAPTP
jgi:hypothetical protein